jgi:hypothetical protein
MHITQEMLRLHFAYDPSTGQFDRANGKACGWLTEKGYLRVRFMGAQYRVHRLIWLYHHGAQPIGEIDHINGDRLDNRISNLRLVTPTINRQNQRKARSDSKTGLLGASPTGGGLFRAQIGMPGGIRKFLGNFESAEMAHQRYIKEKRALHAGGTI